MRPPTLWRRLWTQLVVPTLSGATEDERRLVDLFRREVEALAAESHDTESDWAGHRARVRHLVLHGNPVEFQRWDVVRATMVAGDTPYVAAELAHLRRRPDWRRRWQPAIRESPLGRPRPFYLYPRSSGTLIHHAYHACRFEEATGVALDRASLVVEFGGGYGSMCRLVHGLGFAGAYVIFDLPEFSALQRFYLRSLDIPASTEPAARGVTTVSNLETLATLLRGRDRGGGVFIATWSLSESPRALRETVLRTVEGFDAFLIAYQQRFAEVANDEFFAAWRSRLPGGLTWQEIPIEHLKKASWYLFGVRPGRAASAGLRQRSD